jgi:hypothetical protein
LPARKVVVHADSLSRVSEAAGDGRVEKGRGGHVADVCRPYVHLVRAISRALPLPQEGAAEGERQAQMQAQTGRVPCVVVVPEADEAAWRQLLQRAPFCTSGVFEAVANVDS